jgi:hypothetical protein
MKKKKGIELSGYLHALGIIALFIIMFRNKDWRHKGLSIKTSEYRNVFLTTTMRQDKGCSITQSVRLNNLTGIISSAMSGSQLMQLFSRPGDFDTAHEWSCHQKVADERQRFYLFGRSFF